MAALESLEHNTNNTAEDRNWHAESYQSVLSMLGSDVDGLTPKEVEERRSAYGANAFSKKKGTTFLQRLIAQCMNPLTLVLLAAAVITFVIGDVVDGSVITFALCIAIFLGLFQEGRASRAFQKLEDSQVHMAFVLREGKRHEILAGELVPGDIVILQSGVQVPADMRLVDAKHLMINEAPLTGEWLAVTKALDALDVGTSLAEQNNLAWKGTFVVDGYGSGVVVATGDNTEVGKLSHELQDVLSVETPLQFEMKRVSRAMFIVIAVLVVAIFALGILRGESVSTMLITAIAIAVASIPEGLPAAVTIVLAVGMEALLRRGGLVRNLLAAETLGSATFVLTDKTGTLTEGRMAVTHIIHSEHEGGLSSEEWKDDVTSRMIFDTALCASDAFMDEISETLDTYVVRGEPMERAILEAALDIGIAPTGESARAKRSDFLSFSSENRFAAGVFKDEQGFRMCINGAPEYILEAATHVEGARGAVVMTREQRALFAARIEKLTKEGKRVIGVGTRQVSSGTITASGEGLIAGNTFMGLIVFHDPVRKGVSASIEAVQKAGAHVRLVTGDNPETALTIARAVGIARPHDIALTGKDIATLSDSELYTVIKTTPVFARILPRQKMRLAQILQKHGEIVAMTGDGINDAPALQKAHIGIALGSGTEVAKEASDLVLVNDSFEIVQAAIEEGRRIMRNLQKIVGYLLSTSLSELVLIGAALVVGVPMPLVPAQILWANLIEEGLMSVAFAFEPGDKNAMKEKPRDIHTEGILDRHMLSFIALIVVVLSGLLLGLYAFLLAAGLPIDQLRSVMFLAVSIDSLFMAFSFRALSVPLWSIPFTTNKFFLGSFVISMALLFVAISIPFMQTLLSYTPLPLSWVLLTILYGLVTMIVIEVAKWFFFEKRNAA